MSIFMFYFLQQCIKHHSDSAEIISSMCKKTPKRGNHTFSDRAGRAAAHSSAPCLEAEQAPHRPVCARFLYMESYKRYVWLCGCLLSLSKMFSRFIHIVASVSDSSFSSSPALYGDINYLKEIHKVRHTVP